MRVLFVTVCLVATVFGRPQEIASEDEVELIPPVSTNTDTVEGENDPVVVVLRIPNIGGDGDSDGGFGFPGFSGLPGFGGNDSPFSGLFPGGRPRIPQIPQVPRIPQISGDAFDLFDDIFSGVPRDDVVDDGEVEFVEPVDTTPVRPHGCGLICTMFGIFNGLQGEIDNINKEIHHGDGGALGGGFGGVLNGLFPQGDGEVSNSTYEVKVLDDGTKVGVNKTVISDVDENGNTFFMQTTFTHTIGGDNDKVPALPQPEIDYTADYPEQETDLPEQIPEEIPEEVPEVIEDLLPTEDPSINEIEGVDEGLME